MNKTFTSMKTTVGNNIQDTSTEMLSLIGGYLNDRYVEIKQRLKNALIQTSRLDYEVTVSTEDIVLPEDCGDIVSVLDKTNKVQLEETTEQVWVNKNYGAIDTSSSVNSYFVYNSPVRTQPSSSGVISVVSNSASDTTQTIYIRMIDSNGRQTDESLTLNGTSSVAGAVSTSRVLGISKSAVTVGSITITSGSDTLSILSPDAVTSRVKLLRFISPPASSINVEIIYIQDVLPMLNDYDYPIIDCADALEAGATADGWRYKRMFQKASVMESLYEKKVANVAYNYEAHPNRVTKFNPITYSRNLS